jgi:hypothetical protein
MRTSTPAYAFLSLREKNFVKVVWNREMGGYVTEMGGQEEMRVAKLVACRAGTLQD